MLETADASPFAIFAPAVSYDYVDDLAILTTHFNPLRYRTKKANFDAFRRPLIRSRLPLYVIEQVHGSSDFDLPKRATAIRVRGGDAMWQKERLLNVLLEQIPRRYTKIAWIDADILFSNRAWATEASRLLDSAAVVQLFERAVRLPPAQASFTGEGEWHRSFASVFRDSPQVALHGRYDHHGHTGFAWAIRRDAIPHGFYDACISGSGDHVMAHAFLGDWHSSCLARTFGEGAMYEHYVAWCESVYPVVRARLAAVPGVALHLWHGDMVNRRYADRNTELIRMGFDPFRDIAVDDSGCWTWANRRSEYSAWAHAYFANRREDTYATAEQLAAGSSGF